MPITRTARRSKDGPKQKKKDRAGPEDSLIGAVVKAVRPMTETEIVHQGWTVPTPPGVWPTCIEFTNGEIITASESPDAGTSYRPGTLIGVDESGALFQIRTACFEDPPAAKYGPTKPFPLPAAQISGRKGRIIRTGASDD